MKLDTNIPNTRKRKYIKITLFLLAALLFSFILISGLSHATPELICEKEEHKHNAECENKVLICDLESYSEKINDNSLDIDDHKNVTSGSQKQDSFDYEEETTSIEETTASANEETTSTEQTTTSAKEEVTSHTHTDECYKTEFICGLDEHQHNAECYLSNENIDIRKAETDDVIVTIQLPKDSGIPKEAELVVNPITEENAEGRHDFLVDVTNAQIIKDDQKISSILFYDISFLLDGEEIEPQKDAQISIKYKESAFSVEEIESASELLILHMKEDGDYIEAENISRSLENLDLGVTEIRFSTESFSTFVVVLIDTQATGNFYQKVNRIDSTTANYLIVSVQGGMALTQMDNAPRGTYIDLSPVKGNPNYYSTDDIITNSMRFKFDSTITNSGLSNIQCAAGNYLYFTSKTEDIFYKSSPSYKMSITYNGDGVSNKSALYNTWLIRYGATFRLTNSAVKFQSKAEPESSGTGDARQSYMLIYKEVYTTLTVPGDVSEDTVDVFDGRFDNPTPPIYNEYKDTSDKKTGDDVVGDRGFHYESDKASSQIENDSIFSGNIDDDGKVWADKSVIYMNDDYDAISSYESGSFGVTLSALSQQYVEKQNASYKIPMDFVFIVDTSNSMNVEDANGESRISILVRSLNAAINEIMQKNPHNRVALVEYGTTSSEVISLGRYYVAAAGVPPDYENNDYEYIQIVGKTPVEDSEDLAYKYRYTVALNPLIRTESGQALQNNHALAINGATFTQIGIEQGANVFFNNNDTTYTLPTGQVVTRTPVVMLLSDGEPTIATDNYMDPYSGPAYGSGAARNASGDNAKGVMGYYTILTANYFKQMIGIHYNTPANFYTIGMGIYTGSEEGSPYKDAAGMPTGDEYKRAVLNPTKANIDILPGRPEIIGHEQYYGKQLYQLLNNSFPEKYVTVRGKTYTEISDVGYPYGQTATSMPVHRNMYEDYDYADDSWFGVDLSADTLSEIFDTVIVKSTKEIINAVHIFSNNSSLQFTDTLGAGMEVKGDLVIRYEGKNYNCTVFAVSPNSDGSITKKYRVPNQTYVSNAYGKKVDLQKCIVKVTIMANGQQKVEWEISEELMPAYIRNFNYDYFFEMLPIRLIFKVGLNNYTMSNMAPNQTYYSNDWENSSTMVKFIPSDDNQYYLKSENLTFSSQKEENTSGTANTYFSASKVGSEMRISLGNNGKLVSQERAVNVTVNKIWKNPDGTVADDASSFSPITVQLHRRLASSASSAPYGEAVSLSANKDWTHTWYSLPAEDSSGEVYIYSVEENLEDTDYYSVTYENNSVSVINKQEINITNRRAFTDISVSKSWYDYFGLPSSGQGNDDVHVILYRTTNKMSSGAAVSITDNPIALGTSNNWEHVWKKLPLTNQNGDPYYYYVIEIPVQNYKTTYQVGESVTEEKSDFVTQGNIRVINKAVVDSQPAQGDLTVQKIWLDEDGLPLDNSKTQNVDITLYKRTGSIPKAPDVPDLPHTVTVTVGTVEHEDQEEWIDVEEGGTVDVNVTFYIRNSWLVGDPPVVTCSLSPGSSGIWSGPSTFSHTEKSPLSGSSYFYKFEISGTISNVTGNLTLNFAKDKGWFTENAGTGQVTTITLSRQGNSPSGKQAKSSSSEDITWESVSEVESVTLNSLDSWSHTWHGLTAREANDLDEKIYYYYYYIEEEAIDGFATSYSSNNITAITGDNYGLQHGNISVTNQMLPKETGDISVTKNWIDQYGSPLDDSEKQEVNISLYRRAGYNPDSSNAGPNIDPNKEIIWGSNELIDTQALSDLDNWTYEWTDLPSKFLDSSEGITYHYFYYILEEPINGFAASYSSNNIMSLDNSQSGNYGIQSGEIAVTNKKLTALQEELPQTGGPGTSGYTALGIFLIATSLLTPLLRRLRKKRSS